jgi:hypothetical protein
MRRFLALTIASAILAGPLDSVLIRADHVIQ